MLLPENLCERPCIIRVHTIKYAIIFHLVFNAHAIQITIDINVPKKKRARKSIYVLRAYTNVIKMLCVSKWFMDGFKYSMVIARANRENERDSTGSRDRLNGKSICCIGIFCFEFRKCQRLTVWIYTRSKH